MIEFDDPDEKSSVFNYGKFKVNHMANLHFKATYYYTKGDVMNWYIHIRALKNQIKNQVTKEEYPRLKKLENTIDRILSYRNYSSESVEANEFNKKIIQSIYKYVDLYESFVYKALEEKGYGDQFKSQVEKLDDD